MNADTGTRQPIPFVASGFRAPLNSNGDNVMRPVIARRIAWTRLGGKQPISLGINRFGWCGSNYKEGAGANDREPIASFRLETIMAGKGSTTWDGGAVVKWLESRIVAARAEQAAAERGGRGQNDDCDKAAAEEMVCSLVKGDRSTGDAAVFMDVLQSLLDRDYYVWRGIYDDRKFDRHVRSFIKKLIKMTKANDGFGNIAHYQ